MRPEKWTMNESTPNVLALASCKMGVDPANYVGADIRFEQVTPTFGAVSRRMRITNWDLFDGMVLAVTFTDGRAHKMEGTAIMVAPGVALCAKHVFDDYLSETAKTVGTTFCFRIAKSGAQAWLVTRLQVVPRTDLCILGLEYQSVLAAAPIFRQASITTRLPKVGEQLIISGFRASSPVFESKGGGSIDLSAEMLICSGVVTAQYPTASGRDRVTAPWPCIEVDCPSWGGMSGGPVLDQRGFIVGLISRGWNCADDPSPMLTALLWPALGLEMKSFGWPPSLGSAGRSLLNMKECRIEGADAIRISESVPDTLETIYVPWS
jgi:hypothetical protein